jgi:hypothetical protein
MIPAGLSGLSVCRRGNASISTRHREKEQGEEPSKKGLQNEKEQGEKPCSKNCVDPISP